MNTDISINNPVRIDTAYRVTAALMCSPAYSLLRFYIYDMSGAQERQGPLFYLCQPRENSLGFVEFVSGMSNSYLARDVVCCIGSLLCKEQSKCDDLMSKKYDVN